MKIETKYKYEKRIKELEKEVKRLEDDVYQYHSACSEIYDGCTEVLEKGSTAVLVSWLLRRLKRAWRP